MSQTYVHEGGFSPQLYNLYNAVAIKMMDRTVFHCAHGTYAPHGGNPALDEKSSKIAQHFILCRELP